MIPETPLEELIEVFHRNMQHIAPMRDGRTNAETLMGARTELSTLRSALSEAQKENARLAEALKQILRIERCEVQDYVVDVALAALQPPPDAQQGER